jgi:hypothetical protein
MKNWFWLPVFFMLWACTSMESVSHIPSERMPMTDQGCEGDIEKSDHQMFFQNPLDQDVRGTKIGEPHRRLLPESYVQALAGKRHFRAKAFVPWRVAKPQGEQTAAVVFGILALVVGIAAMLGGFFILVMGVLALAGGDASALWQWGLWLTLTAGGGIVLSILNLAFSYARLSGTEGLGWAALGMNLGAITIGLLVLLLAPQGE